MPSLLILILFLTLREGAATILATIIGGQFMKVEEVGFLTDENGKSIAFVGKGYSVIAHDPLLAHDMLGAVERGEEFSLMTRKNREGANDLILKLSAKIKHLGDDNESYRMAADNDRRTIADLTCGVKSLNENISDLRAGNSRELTIRYEAGLKEGQARSTADAYARGKKDAESVASEANLAFHYNLGLNEGHDDGVDDGRAEVITQMIQGVNDLIKLRNDGKNSASSILTNAPTFCLTYFIEFLNSFNRVGITVGSPIPEEGIPFNTEGPSVVSNREGDGGVANREKEIADRALNWPYGGARETESDRDMRRDLEATSKLASLSKAFLGGQPSDNGKVTIGIPGRAPGYGMGKGTSLHDLMAKLLGMSVGGTVTGRLGGSHPSESLLKEASSAKRDHSYYHGPFKPRGFA